MRLDNVKHIYILTKREYASTAKLRFFADIDAWNKQKRVLKVKKIKKIDVNVWLRERKVVFLQSRLA